jgi:hypothetical protein
MRELLPPGVGRKRMKEIEQRRSALFKQEFLPSVRPFPQVRELFKLLRANSKKVALQKFALRARLLGFRQERMVGLAVVPMCNIPQNRAVVHQPEASPCIFLKRDLPPWPLRVWRARPFRSQPVLSWQPLRPPC